MNTVTRILIFSLSLFLSNFVLAADYKIGFVDIQKILRESSSAKAAQKKLESEFSSKNKQLEAKSNSLKKMVEKYKKEKDILSKDQAEDLQNKIMKEERDFKRDATEAQEDFKIRRNDELGKIEDRLKEVILSIAKSGKYDLIFTNADVAYASDTSSINITDIVLKQFGSK